MPIVWVERGIESTESKEWFFAYLNERFSRDVFLSLESMRDQLNLIGVGYGNLPHSSAMLIICQNRKKSTKKKKDIIFDVIQRKNGEENTTRIITR